MLLWLLTQTQVCFICILPPQATQAVTVQVLQQLCAIYGWPLTIESDRGPHFNGEIVQQLALQQGIQWIYHMPYNPLAAGMIECYNGLLKTGLQATAQGTLTLRRWHDCLWLVVQCLNEYPQQGGVAPIEALLQCAAALIQLQVTMRDPLLKPQVQ